MLADAIEQSTAIGRKPAGAVVVHIVGQNADYDPIRRLCQTAGIPIIEDAAEALGATYRGAPAGGLGSIGVLSFNGNKILTTSTGGALLADDDLIDQALFLATQARERRTRHHRVGWARFRGRTAHADIPVRGEQGPR